MSISHEEMLKLLKVPGPLTITIRDDQRQMVLLALGHLLARRPGWNLPIDEIAELLQGKAMMEEFRKHVVAYSHDGKTDYSQAAWNAALVLCDGCYITGNPTRQQYIGVVANVIERFAIKGEETPNPS